MLVKTGRLNVLIDVPMSAKRRNVYCIVGIR